MPGTTQKVIDAINAIATTAANVTPVDGVDAATYRNRSWDVEAIHNMIVKSIKSMARHNARETYTVGTFTCVAPHTGTIVYLPDGWDVRVSFEGDVCRNGLGFVQVEVNRYGRTSGADVQRFCRGRIDGKVGQIHVSDLAAFCASIA